MTTLQIEDNFMLTVLETKYHNDKAKFLKAIKTFLQTNSKAETYEYNLLTAYHNGELSIGQISKILNLSKTEILDLMQKYDIPFVEVDEQYLKHELNAFE